VPLGIEFLLQLLLDKLGLTPVLGVGGLAEALATNPDVGVERTVGAAE
jgi:hypothetical protein